MILDCVQEVAHRSIGAAWLKTFFSWGGAGGGEFTTGIMNFNLKKSQVRKRRKNHLEAGFSFCFLSLHHPNNRSTNIYFLYLHLLKPIQKCMYVCTLSGFGGLGVACWPLVPKFPGSNPAETVGFLGRKNPQHAFLRRGSKAVGPMS